MEQLGTVETICRYPVKSMAGETVEAAFAGYGGLMGDRVYGFMRAGGTTGFPWLTAREAPDLVLYRPRFRAGEAAALPPDLAASLTLGPGVNPVFPPESAFEVDVETPEGKTLPLRSPELAPERAHRRVAEERERAAVGEAALAEAERDAGASARTSTRTGARASPIARTTSWAARSRSASASASRSSSATPAAR